MVTGVGDMAVGPEQQSGTGAARRSRREVARGLLASAAALALTPVIAASRPAPPSEGAGDGSFDETYRGRRIRGVPVSAADQAAAGAGWRITVDGRPLHLMRRADGTWLSMIDHYTSYRTPLEATRAAVDEMGPGRRLRDPMPGRPDGHGGPGRHGFGGDGSGAYPDGLTYLEGPHGVRA